MRRPRQTLIAIAVFTAIAAWGAASLWAGGTKSVDSLLAKPSSAVGRATAAQQRTFGAEPIYVALNANLATTLDPSNLTTLASLEQRLARLPGVKTVFGPGTFIQQTVQQLDSVIRQQMAALRTEGLAARKALATLLVRYGYVGVPSLSNETFVGQLVFGSGTTPKRRFTWLFPDDNHAVILIRPRGGLSDAQTRTLGARIVDLVHQAPLQGVRTTVAGVPLVAAGLVSQFSTELARIAPIALVAMAFVLLLCLGRRLASLALLLPAGGAVLLTAALSDGLGLGLTPATIAALPVILGLAIDYSIQLHARHHHLRAAGVKPAEAATGAARALAPTLILAGGVMAAGFLALELSGVPLVQRIGLELAIGVAASLFTVFTFVPPLLARTDRSPRVVAARRLPLPELPPKASKVALGVITVGALAGLALSASAPVSSDLASLAPRGMPQLVAAQRLQRELGSGGQLWVEVHGRNLTSAASLRWMNRVETRVTGLSRRVTPGPNLAALLSTGNGDTVPNAQQADSLLALVPHYFTAAVLSPDHTRAELSFGVPLQSGARQATLIARLEQALAHPPAGVTAQPAGVIAESVASLHGLEHGRPWLLLAAALVIFMLLLAVRRELRRALVPLVPALLAAGGSALIVAVTGLSLSPLAAGLDPLVLAVGVEFGVLLEARYHEARATGLEPEAAARLAVVKVGTPIAVAALTVGCGFATLIASRFGVLVQFGALAAVEVLLTAVAAIAFVPLLAAALEPATRPNPVHGEVVRRPLAVVGAG